MSRRRVLIAAALSKFAYCILLLYCCSKRKCFFTLDLAQRSCILRHPQRQGESPGNFTLSSLCKGRGKAGRRTITSAAEFPLFGCGIKTESVAGVGGGGV